MQLGAKKTKKNQTKNKSQRQHRLLEEINISCTCKSKHLQVTC